MAGGDRLAGRRAAARAHAVERRVARPRGRRVGLCSTRGRAVEGEHADVHARGTSSTNARAAPLARPPAAMGLTSVAVHRARHVGGEHDRRALDRHGDRALRLGRGDDQHGQREREGEHRRVAAPARPARRDRRLQRGRRRRRPRRRAGRAARRTYHQHEQRQSEQRDQDERRGEAHGVGPRGTGAERRRRASTGWPSRWTSTVTWSPGVWPATAAETSAGSATRRPSMLVITSSTCRPARWAGLPGCDRRCTRAPSRARRRGAGRWTRPGRRARSSGRARSAGTTWRTVFDGTAKPMPTLPREAPPVAICELTPITRPSSSSSGPPELPGLIGASVWMTESIEKPLGAWISRPSAGDDALGGGAVEAERVADRDREVADAHAARVGEAERRHVRACRRARSSARRGRATGRCRAPGRRSRRRRARSARRRGRRRRRRARCVTIVPSRSMRKPVPVPRARAHRDDGRARARVDGADARLAAARGQRAALGLGQRRGLVALQHACRP